MNVKNRKKFSKKTINVALALCTVSSIGLSSNVFALGVETLEGKHIQNYVTDDMLQNADKDPNNWLLYGRDYESTRFSPLAKINTENVSELVPKWNLSFGVVGAQDSQVSAVNGRLYVTSSHNRIFSLDGITGKIIWKYEHPLPGNIGPRLCCGAVNRGAAVYKDKVYMATLDAHMVALDNKTGEVVWKKKLGDYKTGAQFTSMPVALQGKIIIGNASGDVGANRGTIFALDAETGDIIWESYTVPAPGEKGHKTWGGDSWKLGGGAPWMSGNYDKETGLLLWGVGNPVPAFDRSIRPGDNLYTNSTIAMNPDTGVIQWYFQYTPNGAWDYDGTNEVILITDKEGRKVYIHADRNGHLYSIDRTNGKCNWVEPMTRVNWVEKFGNNCRPVVNQDKVPRYDHVTKDIAPTLGGGKEWHPAAYSKRTGMIYIPVIDMAMDLAAHKQEFKTGEWYLGTKLLKLHPGAGYLKAFDATTGELQWSRSQNTPSTSGILATDGGLVFAGDAEGMFRAVKDDTGETLWEYNVGSGVHSSPTTYTVGGKQYVAVLVGPGGGSLWPLVYGDWLKTNTKGGSLFVFGLHAEK